MSFVCFHHESALMDELNNLDVFDDLQSINGVYDDPERETKIHH